MLVTDNNLKQFTWTSSSSSILPMLVNLDRLSCFVDWEQQFLNYLVDVVYDTSPKITTRAAHIGLLFEGLRL
jgi:hypothetical protein